MGASAFADDDDHEHEGEHFDIGVWNDNGILRTGGWDHDEEALEVQNLRVFEAHFGEDEEFPYSIDEPGIGGVAADLGLPLDATLTVSMFSGLSVWNGAGFESASTDMTVDYGPLSVNSNTGGDLDFLITEDFDLHPIYSINPAADTGSYLLEFTAVIDGFTASDSFWIVFNLGMDDEEFEGTVEWVEDNLVPAPGALGMLAVSVLTPIRRRRRC
ncbi:MAG: hypothetical protein MK085_12565 [Phycisphaerales bacterium]|nr:hypothetical protein [Phycisphaerales bacterium]